MRATSEARKVAGDTGAKPGARWHMRERYRADPGPERARLRLSVNRQRNVGDAGMAAG